MYARFFETEREAHEALATWAAKVRGDWSVSGPHEMGRDPAPGGGFLAAPWGEGFVAPAYRSQVRGRPLRLLRVVARGPFARWGERDRGTASAVLEVAFPAGAA